MRIDAWEVGRFQDGVVGRWRLEVGWLGSIQGRRYGTVDPSGPSAVTSRCRRLPF